MTDGNTTMFHQLLAQAAAGDDQAWDEVLHVAAERLRVRTSALSVFE